MPPEPIPIGVACWDYDRTAALIDGRVRLEGCAPRFTILPPQELFPRAFGAAEFDVSELSLSRHAQAVAAGRSRYAGVPVFLSRAFRHGSVYVRTDRGIAAPAQLRGRRLGLRNFDDTAAVVVRANRAMLDATLRHLHADGLLVRPLAVDELFTEEP